MITKSITLDMNDPGLPQIVHAKQGEQGGCQILVNFVAEGQPWAVPSGATLSVFYRRQNGTGGGYGDTVIWPDEDFAAEKNNRYEINVLGGYAIDQQCRSLERGSPELGCQQWLDSRRRHPAGWIAQLRLARFRHPGAVGPGPLPLRSNAASESGCKIKKVPSSGESEPLPVKRTVK